MAQNNITDYALAPGTVLASATTGYTIQSVLGVGGFGVTYLATYSLRANGVEEIRRVAIKEHFMTDYNEREGTSPRVLTNGTARIKEIVDNSMKDFLAEARRLRQVGEQHPNIVKVGEVFEANGTAYYVMEYLEGRTLWEYISGRPFDERTMLGVMMPIVNAVAFLHRRNLTHLDIKPQNIMIIGTGTATRPVLIDFGLSKHYDEHGNATSTVKTMASSDGYSPIEQYSGISKFSPTADVYALGATMLACLTGTTPTKSTEWGAGEPMRSIAMLPLSQPVALALSCAMSPMAGYRYPDAAAFESAITGAPMPAAQGAVPPPTTPAAATRVLNSGNGGDGNGKKRKGPITVELAAISVILLIVAATAAYLLVNRNHAAPDEPWIPDTTAAVQAIVAHVGETITQMDNSGKDGEETPGTEPVIAEYEPVIAEEEPVIEIAEPSPAIQEADQASDLNPGPDIRRVDHAPEEPVTERTYSISMVEQRPQFPGGEAAMYRYISDNIVYPSAAAESGIQGRVHVEFIVEKDGSISGVRVIRSREPSLDAEAVRVVRAMPRWAPGRNNGEPVRVHYTLPVTFRLQ